MIGRRNSPSTEEADKPKGFDDFELRLGDIMRGERATLAKSLLDVQRELKIKASYVAAIENADISAFDTPGFVAGYVRSYARYLGMDAEWAFERFCDEAKFTVAHGMSAAASGPKPGRRKVEYSDPLANPNASFIPRGEAFLSGVQPGAIGSILVLLLLIGGIGFGGWTVLQEVQKVQLSPVDSAPGVVADLDPLAAGGTGFVLAPQAADVALTGVLDSDRLGSSDALDRLYRPQALDVPIFVARDGPIAAIDPESVGTLVVAAPDGEVIDNTPTTLGETPVQVVADVAPGVQILAVRPSWVRIQAADGSVIFEKILDAGERYAVPAMDEAPTLRAGNSGSVYFAVNGQTYGPAAPGAQVVKNVSLMAAALTEAYTLADLAQDADLAKIVDVAANVATGQ